MSSSRVIFANGQRTRTLSGPRRGLGIQVGALTNVDERHSPDRDNRQTGSPDPDAFLGNQSGPSGANILNYHGFMTPPGHTRGMEIRDGYRVEPFGVNLTGISSSSSRGSSQLARARWGRIVRACRLNLTIS